jgi:hypothetical protein
MSLVCCFYRCTASMGVFLIVAISAPMPACSSMQVKDARACTYKDAYSMWLLLCVPINTV